MSHILACDLSRKTVETERQKTKWLDPTFHMCSNTSVNKQTECLYAFDNTLSRVTYSRHTCVTLLISMHHNQPCRNVKCPSPHVSLSIHSTCTAARVGLTTTYASTPCRQHFFMANLHPAQLPRQKNRQPHKAQPESHPSHYMHEFFAIFYRSYSYEFDQFAVEGPHGVLRGQVAQKCIIIACYSLQACDQVAVEAI